MREQTNVQTPGKKSTIPDNEKENNVRHTKNDSSSLNDTGSIFCLSPEKAMRMQLLASQEQLVKRCQELENRCEMTQRALYQKDMENKIQQDRINMLEQENQRLENLLKRKKNLSTIYVQTEDQEET